MELTEQGEVVHTLFMQCIEPGCRSNFAKTDKNSSWYGYCFRHAQKRELISKEELGAFEEKRTEAIRESWKGSRLSADGKRRSKSERKKIEGQDDSKARKKVEEEKKREAREAQDLIHRILGDQEYDAALLVQEMEEMGGLDIGKDPRMQKTIFMQWHLADPKSRKPVGLWELCKLIKLPLSMGKAWMESDWFVSDLHAAMQKSMKLAMPYLARVVLGKAIGGDFNAVKEFLKVFGKHERGEGDTNWNDQFDDDVLQEANEIAELAQEN